jgi:transcriptional regulator with XRE-family HTH domain
MIPPDTSFEQFFAEKIKERGISLKKLSDVTGIAPAHIESLLRGDHEHMPSAPYLHGYLVRLGSELGFDGEEWWAKFKKDGLVKNSGELDTLPKNRFIKQSPPKYLWVIVAGIVILIYLGFQTPHIFGKPRLTVTFPDADPYVTASSTFTLTGTVSDVDSLSLLGESGEQEPIIINPDGSWSKTVLLGVGPNPFEIAAKKFLGGETDVTENIFYQSVPGGATTTASGIPMGDASGTLPTSSSGNVSGTPAL